MAARYRDAIEWIALNDDTSERDVGAISTNMTTSLVADIFGKERMQVARAVLRVRKAVLK